MLFDLLVCIGIIAITPMVAIIFPNSCLVLYRRMAPSTTDKHLNSNNTVPKLVHWTSTAFLISSPFLVAMSGILEYSHHWEWYLGCLLCGIISFCTFCFCVFATGRKAFMKNYLVLIPLTVVFIIGAICIAVRS